MAVDNKGNRQRFQKPLPSLLAMLISLMGQGCASFGMGQSEFSCPGGVEGVHCLSARQTYQATNGGDEVQPTTKNANGDDKPKQVVTVKSGPVPVPTIEQPLPIRTQAKVMRIWIAPWEDTDGDLHADGYVYTEIEGRKWNLGGRLRSPNPVLQPLTK